MTEPETTLRVDVQVLRAVAVIAVVLYHAGVPFAQGGYLGVDVFFVVSGYLITGIIERGLSRSTFRFSEFYWRRFKRLAPASLAVFMATGVACVTLLTPSRIPSALAQLRGALLFVANVVLWDQTGYFGPAAELSPYLHAWSLAIEEQFYLFLPVALAVVSTRWRVRALTVGLVLSAVACFALAANKPAATFYLLPFRAWELLVGSVTCYLARREVRARWMSWVGSAAVSVILALCVWPLDSVHPRGNALGVCLATAWVLSVPLPLLNTSRLARLLRPIGDISYSLYLVHWPALVFARVLFLGEPPAEVIASVVLASLVGALVLYRLVEDPARHATTKHRGRVVLATLVVTAVATGSLHLAGRSPADDAWTRARSPNYGLGRECDSDGISVAPTCATSPSPAVIVWGDSFAMHLVPGLANVLGDRGLIQATRSGCGPLLDAVPLSTRYPRPWGESCAAFNASVLSYISEHPELRTVVLSTRLLQYLEPGTSLLVGERVMSTSPAAVGRSYARTVQQLVDLGRHVVVVGPPATASFDAGDCAERTERGLPVLGHDATCVISQGAYESKFEGALQALRFVQGREDIRVLLPADVLCQSGRCASKVEGTWLYRDTEHFSNEGSVAFARGTDFWDQLGSDPAL